MIFYYHSGYFSIHHFLAAKVTLLFTSLLKLVQFNFYQLLDEVFVISGIFKVAVRVISRPEAEANNTYQELDFFRI